MNDRSPRQRRRSRATRLRSAQAPYVCIAAWPGSHDNPHWPRFEHGIVHFLDTDLSALKLTKPKSKPEVRFESCDLRRRTDLVHGRSDDLCRRTPDAVQQLRSLGERAAEVLVENDDRAVRKVLREQAIAFLSLEERPFDAHALGDVEYLGDRSHRLPGFIADDADAQVRVDDRTVLANVALDPRRSAIVLLAQFASERGSLSPIVGIPELEAYTTKQADWFTEPSFAAADREVVWKVVNLFHYGPHMASSLAAMHTGELAALPSRQVLSYYTDGFNPAGNSIQLSAAAPTLAKALLLGQAMKDLAGFVPGAVLRHVIPESGLQYMMTAGKIPDLECYYKTFRPSLEKPEEWTHVEELLREGVRTNAVLAGWISELHIFTPTTRSKLKANITDKSRTKPVLLVVMSALDWNTAFLQGANVEQSVTDPHNLGLVVQGRTLGAATAQVSRVAKDYGKGGKLGQFVLAGRSGRGYSRVPAATRSAQPRPSSRTRRRPMSRSLRRTSPPGCSRTDSFDPWQSSTAMPRSLNARGRSE